MLIDGRDFFMTILAAVPEQPAFSWLVVLKGY